MPASHKLIVMDLNNSAVESFMNEFVDPAASEESAKSLPVETSENIKEVAERCVRLLLLVYDLRCFDD